MDEVFKRGERGDAIRDIQSRLQGLGYDLGEAGPDGIFGPDTEAAVLAFQGDRGIDVDGIVGGRTWKELVEASYELGDRLLYLRTPFFRGDDVARLQRYSNTLGFDAGHEDSVFGPQADQAVRQFQRASGLVSDGIVGPSTLAAFERLRMVLNANQKPVPKAPVGRRSPAVVFKGRRVFVDCRSEDCGGATPEASTAVCLDLVARLANLLEILGAEVVHPGTLRQEDDLVLLANEARANVFVALRLGCDHPGGGGACYYFGSQNGLSEAGEKLAGLIQVELTGSVGLPDRGTQSADWRCLRKTAMPAVVVEPACFDAPDDAELLGTEVFRQKVAVAVFDGLKRFFEG